MIAEVDSLLSAFESLVPAGGAGGIVGETGRERVSDEPKTRRSTRGESRTQHGP